MKTILKLTALLLVLAGSYSCQEKESAEIPFTDYSLEGTSCQWKTLENDTLIIVNNDNALDTCLVCPGEFPEIDFTAYTLIFAGGTAINGGIDLTPKSLTKENDYLLLTIKNNFKDSIAPMVLTPWNVAILVNKVSQDTKIQLIIQ